MANTDLLRKVRHKMAAEPDTHDQSIWISADPGQRVDHADGLALTYGTTACVAGWTALLSGDRLIVPMYATDDNIVTAPFDVANVFTVDGVIESVYQRARKLLDINYVFAEALFDGGNSRGTVLTIIDQIIEQEVL
ncbi:MAG: hypothetical protein DI630_00945 [Gordonia sp. (in: high G+C Gram-positive bacteria)]|nr:MAG: hypothetical protein DI630_00945 [Gordonia sp. (in: high G+C Gram-positive bacteria)]